MITFSSVSVWAVAGAGIKKWLNFILVALLAYCAVTLSGIFTVYL